MDSINFFSLSFLGEKNEFKIISDTSNINIYYILPLYNNFRGNYKRIESRQSYILYCFYTEKLGGKKISMFFYLPNHPLVLFIYEPTISLAWKGDFF